MNGGSTGFLGFSDRDIRLIAASLPDGIDQRRLSLLPLVLQDWAAGELSWHLEEPRQISPESRKSLRKIEQKIGELLRELDDLDDLDERVSFDLAYHTAVARGFSILGAGAAILDKRGPFEEVRNLLPKMAAAVSKIKGPGRGRPRNSVEPRVIADAAAIFEWLAGRPAGRSVDRTDHFETGPFRQFAEALWPVVFGVANAGLTTAVRNWQSTGEKSRIIERIAWHHPTWQIFGQNPEINAM